MSPGLVLCVGEPIVALTPTPGFGLADTPHLVVSVGGAEANVAVGLSRLGVSCRYAGAVGDDPFGRRIRSFLAGERVDVGALAVDDDHPTGFYFKDSLGPGRTVYYHRSASAAAVLEEFDPRTFDGATHLHITGVSAALNPRWRVRVEELLTAERWTSSFDVNYRPTLWPAEEAAPVLLDLAARADTVFVGLDEAEMLWGTCTPEQVAGLVRDRAGELRDAPYGQEIVVKNAGIGATVFTGSFRHDSAPNPVEIVEPVGAGDAFAAGYLGGLLLGGDHRAAMRLGHRLAAAVLVVPGDIAPPLHPTEIRTLLSPASMESTP